jgi:hypothetical protein
MVELLSGRVLLEGKSYSAFMETETVQIEGTESRALKPACGGGKRIAQIFRRRECETASARDGRVKSGSPDRKPEEIL